MDAHNGNTITRQKNHDFSKCFAALKMETAYVASTYCACPNTKDETIDECARFLISQFGHLNAGEVREAFRMAAAGKIDADINAYHGQFSVRIIGDVLSAYDDHRTQIAREVRARMQQAQDEEENAERAAAMKEEFGSLEQQYLALSEKGYERWQDLPEWLCRRLVMENIPGFTDSEKAGAWIDAKHWAVNQIESFVIDPGNTPEDKRRYLAAQQKINNHPDQFPDELMKEAKECYSKRLIFERINKAQ